MTARFRLKPPTLIATLCIAAAAAALAYALFPADSTAHAQALRGYPASGLLLTEPVLEQYLPPPPKDAIPYEVRFPLRNGPAVPVKKRWVWTPPGEKIVVSKQDDGSYDVDVPPGTIWWKEFYLETSQGIELIERRIVLKTEERPNGGWRFFYSGYLPPSADGISGNDATVRLNMADGVEKLFLFESEEWLPTLSKVSSTAIIMKDKAGQSYHYNFPGGAMCNRCHVGAKALWKEEEPDALVFAPHPLKLTKASMEALVKAGVYAYVDGAPPEVDVDDASDLQAQTDRLVYQMRSNCLTCHVDHPEADARVSNFKLSPTKDYSAEELLAALTKPSARAPHSPHLLVQPGEPDQSEMVVRMRGNAGRLRMPPAEGGMPLPDLDLLSDLEEWVEDVAAIAPAEMKTAAEKRTQR